MSNLEDETDLLKGPAQQFEGNKNDSETECSSLGDDEGLGHGKDYLKHETNLMIDATHSQASNIGDDTAIKSPINDEQSSLQEINTIEDEMSHLVDDTSSQEGDPSNTETKHCSMKDEQSFQQGIRNAEDDVGVLAQGGAPIKEEDSSDGEIDDAHINDDQSLRQRLSNIEDKLRLLEVTTPARSRFSRNNELRGSDVESQDTNSKETATSAIRETMAATSFHGIPQLVNVKSWWAKLVWAVCILGSVCLLTLQLTSITQQFLSYPVKTLYGVGHEILPLPAVTVCIKNPFDKAKIRENPTLLQAVEDMVKEEYIPVNSNLTFESSRLYLAVMRAFQSLTEKERIAIGYNSSDIFPNSLLDKGKPNKLIPSFWNGNCYTSEYTKPGVDYNILVNLRLEEYSYLRLPFYAIIAIHDFGYEPVSDVMAIHPGQTTTVKLRLKKVRRLGGKYGDCTDGLEFGNRTGYTYSVPICRELCRIDAIIEACGCIFTNFLLYFYPRHTIPYCKKKSVKDPTYACNLDTFEMQHECNCPPECTENIYSRFVTTGLWANPTAAFYDLGIRCRLLYTKYGMPMTDTECYRYVKANYAHLRVHYQDLMHEKITEVPLYDISRYLSDLGGTIGLYIGASILTYVEFVQLIIVLLVRCFSR